MNKEINILIIDDEKDICDQISGLLNDNDYNTRSAFNNEEALKLIEVGESTRNPNLDAVAHASCAAICSLILNLDETLTKE